MRTLLIASLCLLSQTATGAELTAQETRWLTAAAPVLAYSKKLNLPVDIIVQPTARPGAVPLAMGFDGGRCKLVLTLRGNPDAEAVLAGVPEPARRQLIEAMAAHELGHCWRYAQGAWHSLPAGFVETGAETAADASLLIAAKQIRETRREEGYADLVALAWTQYRNPEEYARVYAWLESVRRNPPVPRGGHDTHAWVQLARDGKRFGDAAQPFEDAAPLWREGLLGGR